MVRKGRPTVDDKRDNQYRVRLNDKEEKMLAYCSQATGKTKSHILRKVLFEYYATVKLNEINRLNEYDTMKLDNISMKRVIECPHCGSYNAIDFENYTMDKCIQEWQMSFETQHWFDCDDYKCAICLKFFRVMGCIIEYPVGAYDSEMIDIIKK